MKDFIILNLSNKIISNWFYGIESFSLTQSSRPIDCFQGLTTLD